MGSSPCPTGGTRPDGDFEESAVSEERVAGGSPAMKVPSLNEESEGQRSAREEAGRSPPISAEDSHPGG